MKKVIVVGAGISGLSAGIFARQSGFDVTIFENHNVPGGASTSWRRKGYHFEGGLHWLTGSSKEVPLNRLWRETGALDDSISIINADPFFTLDYEGKTACLYRDTEKLRRHLIELSPEDEKETNRLCRDVKKFARVSMPVTDLKGLRVKNKSSMSLSDSIKMLPAFPRMLFYNKQSSEEYAERFKSPLLRQFIMNIIGPEFAATGLLFTMATLASGDGGYPLGGSLAIAGRMAKYFESLGGVIRYGTPVSRVDVRNGNAYGVIVNGETVPADAVIVTQDTLAAVDKLFDPPIHEPWTEKMRQNTVPILDTFIGLGVEADLSSLPERISFVPKKPLVCGGEPQKFAGICNYAAYKDYAPEGCTAITCIISGDSYDFWKSCKENGTYQQEKEKLAKAVIEVLADKFPQTAGKVTVWDVATPLTYERYLSSFKGSWMSGMAKGERPANYPTKPESIGNLYFAGQRLVSPGGLPVALDTGRRAAQHLCRDTGAVFQGSL